MFDRGSFDDNEHVTFVSEHGTVLKGNVAIDSSALGPKTGGCRVWNYPDSASAVTDALRPSRRMSYKNATASFRLPGAV